MWKLRLISMKNVKCNYINPYEFLADLAWYIFRPSSRSSSLYLTFPPFISCFISFTSSHFSSLHSTVHLSSFSVTSSSHFSSLFIYLPFHQLLCLFSSSQFNLSLICHALSFSEWTKGSLVQIQKALMVQWIGDIHVSSAKQSHQQNGRVKL